jgi:hypothetical protein
MVWVKTSDDFMLDARVQAVDCCADSALRAAYEVCNRTETDGVFYMGELITRWSPAKGSRRRLRKAIQDLLAVGLVQQLGHDDALQRHTMAVEKGHQFGLRPVKNRHYFEIVDYLEDQPSAEEKRLKKQDVRDRKRRQREKERGRMSHVTSRPPDPEPEPKLRINDHAMPLKEPEPPSTADAPTPSSVTADQDAGSWLRRMLEERWPNPKHPEHIDEIQRLAEREPGDSVATLAVAMDAFDADTSQQKYRHGPQGLVMHWNRYVADHRQQIEASEKKRRGELARQRHEAARDAGDAKHLKEVRERARQRVQNGAGHGSALGGNLGPDLAEWKL